MHACSSSQKTSPLATPGVVQHRGRIFSGGRRKGFHTGFFAGAVALFVVETRLRVVVWEFTRTRWSSGSRHPGNIDSLANMPAGAFSSAAADPRGPGPNFCAGSDLERWRAFVCLEGVDADVGAGDVGADDSGVFNRCAEKNLEIGGVRCFFRAMANGVETPCMIAAGVGHSRARFGRLGFGAGTAGAAVESSVVVPFFGGGLAGTRTARKGGG